MTLGLILAGGRSQRFGSEKGAALLQGQTLLARAHQRLAGACSAIAVSAPAGSRSAELAQDLGARVLSDPADAPRGPLAGILAGLDWARGRGEALLAVLPCDTPLLPADLIGRLIAAVGEAPAAVARSPGGLQPLCAVWKTSLAGTLRAELSGGDHPPVHRVLTEAGAVLVDFPDDQAFANVNSVQDLAEAARRLSGA